MANQCESDYEAKVERWGTYKGIRRAVRRRILHISNQVENLELLFENRSASQVQQAVEADGTTMTQGPRLGRVLPHRCLYSAIAYF